MEYRGCHAEVSYSDEDGLFIGHVRGLKDSLGFHGLSVSELREMFHQSVDNYLGFCKSIGKIPEKECKALL